MSAAGPERAERAEGRPRVIAHRGASGYAPENTRAAFALALEMGARAVEFDVQQSADGRLVVIHDLDLKRLAGLRRRVGALTADELARVDVGRWFSPGFEGERIPSLEAVLAQLGGRAELQLEIKNPGGAYPGIEERVVGLLRGRPALERRVCVSSFDHESLYRVRALASWARLGYLVGFTRRATALREARELDCESVHLSVRQAEGPWAAAVREAGRRLLVYTVNEPRVYERLAVLGADGVFSNFPDLSRRPLAAGRAGTKA